MERTRIVVIGGGSVQWGPKLLRDLALTPTLAGSEVVLMDVDAVALGLLERLARRTFEEFGADLTVGATTDRKEAVRGAEYVIVTISVGGFDTMAVDLDLPRKYGIYQSVGDSTGPGGWSRALRTVPVMLGIARDMERLCPKAWLLNYTNPMVVPCRAISRETGIRAIGLCDGVDGATGRLAAALGLDREGLEVKAAGINHLPFYFSLTSHGEDQLPHIRQAIRERGVFGWVEPDFEETPWTIFDDRMAVKFQLFELLGSLPASGDRHVAEFFPHFLGEATGKGRRYGVQLTTIADRRARHGRYGEQVREWLAGTQPIPRQHSPEDASYIIGALRSGETGNFIMNLPNRGQISNLPRDVVVETDARVSGGNVAPVSAGPLPPAVQCVTYPHVLRQEMIVEAAVTGDRELALEALATDPLMADLSAVRPLGEEMLAALADYLPEFQ